MKAGTPTGTPRKFFLSPSSDWLPFLSITEEESGLVTLPMQEDRSPLAPTEFQLLTGIPIGNQVFQSGHVSDTTQLRRVCIATRL